MIKEISDFDVYYVLYKILRYLVYHAHENDLFIFILINSKKDYLNIYPVFLFFCRFKLEQLINKVITCSIYPFFLFPVPAVCIIIGPSAPAQHPGCIVFLLIRSMHDNIIDFKNHLYDLSRQLNLLLLSDESFENQVVTHVGRADLIAVNSQSRIALC
jgi:hypothetical protein